MTVDPVIVHTCDSVLDLPDDVENGSIGYTASFVSLGDLRQMRVALNLDRDHHAGMQM